MSDDPIRFLLNDIGTPVELEPDDIDDWRKIHQKVIDGAIDQAVQASDAHS